jgi:predicted dehydrogenase
VGGKKVRIGVVGAGFISQVAHLPNLVQCDDCDVIGLAELRPKLGKAVCKKFDIPRFFPHHSDLLMDSDIDAVYVITRRHHTGPIAKDVLEAGKHLFTEKPIAQTYDKARMLGELASSKGLIYSAGFMRRHDDGVKFAKKTLQKLLETKELGNPLFARFYLAAGGDYCNIDGDIKTDEPKPMHEIWPIAPDFVPAELKRSYEHFVNVSSHDINLMRYMFEMNPTVKHVEYRQSRGTVAVFDFGEFSGIFEWTETLQQTRWEEGMEVRFENGELKLDLVPAFLRNQPSKVSVHRGDGQRGGEIYSPLIDWTWAFRNEDFAFVSDVKNGKTPIASGQDSVEDMALIDEIWKQISGVVTFG